MDNIINKKCNDLQDIVITHMESLVTHLCQPNDEFKVRFNDFYETEIFTLIENFNLRIDYANYLPVNYNDFLRTPYWKIIACWVKEIANDRCQICNSKIRLNVHHKTYDHHFDEHNWFKEDLICLCNKCHELFHKNGKLAKDIDHE